MKAIRRSGVIFAVGCAFAFFAALFFVWIPAARADQTTVDDETGLMSTAAITQIDGRNRQLFNATGLVVVVVVVPGKNIDSATLDVPVAADKVAKGYYGAVVFVATEGQKSDILFTGRALKWVAYKEQSALRHDLSDTMRYCCPSDTVPGIVNEVASAMETGSKVAPDSKNYVRDDIGLLDGQQTERIVVREDRLETATGKGVAVVLFNEQPGNVSGTLASSMAQAFNVKGQIAAVVWVAKGQTASHFAMAQTAGYGTIPEATVGFIGNSFQADMQTGNFGEAVVAAVDRTATAIESTSTPIPTQAPLPAESFPPPVVENSGEAGAERPRGSSSMGTAVVVFLALAIIVLFVGIAMRRRNM